MNSPAPQRVDIDLGDRSYPIFIGNQLLTRPELITPYLSGKVMIVTNETIAPLYLNTLLQTLDGMSTSHVVLPDGEQYKNLETLDEIFASLLTDRFDRGCTLIALGGGVVGDMAGFAAASYQRGVNFVQMPTTLLAQVDSSVGGKTGVNHAMGKNMIGAFHQPQAVFADMDTLASLPKRELKAGLAEVIKYGFIIDTEFFDWFEHNIEALLALEPAAINHAVKRSCEIKAEVVAADEHEHGKRALLNFGHTFGHAIEASLGYGEWLHGEAISAGMVMAMDLSMRVGWIGDNTRQRGVDMLDQIGLPVNPPTTVSAATLQDYMGRDKKVIDGALRLILLKAIGDATVTGDVSADELRATLEHFCP